MMKKVLMILLAAGFASLLGVAVVFLYLSPKGETIKEVESILTEEPEQVETEENVTDSPQSSTNPAAVKEIHITGLKAQRISVQCIRNCVYFVRLAAVGGAEFSVDFSFAV